MSTRSIFTRITALTVAFLLILSVSGVAFAASNQSSYSNNKVNHVDVRVDGTLTLETSTNGVIDAGSAVTYSAVVTGVSGSIKYGSNNRTSMLSFTHKSGYGTENEWRAVFNKHTYNTADVVTLTVTLKLKDANGNYIKDSNGNAKSFTVAQSYSGSALLAAIANCPAHSGYDIDFAGVDVTNQITHKVTFKTTNPGGKIDGAYTNIVYDGILEGTAWSKIDVPETVADAGYSFAGWNATFPTAVDKDYTFTATWTALTPVVRNLYTVNYTLDGVAYPTTAAYELKEQSYSGFATVSNPPTMNDGYSFDGWYAGSTKVSSITTGLFTLSSTVVTPAASGSAEIRTNNYTLTLTGTTSEITGTRNEYVVNYSVAAPTGATVGSFTAKAESAAGNIVAQALPTVTGSSEAYSIAGWTVGNTTVAPGSAFNWEGVAGVAGTPVLEDVNGVKTFVTVTTYTINASATATLKDHESEYYYTLSYSITGDYTLPDGTVLTAPAAPTGVTRGSQPTSLAAGPAFNGFTFNGWKQGTTAVSAAADINWGAAVKESSVYDTVNNVYVDTYVYTAALTGDYRMNEITVADYYTLTYAITGTYTEPDGTALTTPAAPAGVTNATSRPTALASAPALKGHTFNGWKQGTDAVVASEVQYAQDGDTTYAYDAASGRYVASTYYTAALTGDYSAKDVMAAYSYNVNYVNRGDRADDSLFPTDVVNASTAPALAEAPAKTGYTFDGWFQGNGNTIINAIAWGTGTVTYSYNSETDTYTRLTTYSVNINGVLLKNETESLYIYVVNYEVTGGTGDYSSLNVNETDPATEPQIAAALSETGKVFSGWTPATLDWGTHGSSSDGWVAGTEYYDETEQRWITPYTKTIAVAGSFASITNNKVDVYTLDVATTQNGATVAGSTTRALTEPTLADCTYTVPTGFKFAGWYQNGSPISAITWTRATEPYSTVTSEDGLAVTMYYENTATVEAVYLGVAEAADYILTYSYAQLLDANNNDITPTNVPDPESDSKPITPLATPATVDGYHFLGWSAPSWVEGEPTVETANGVETTTRHFTATTVGTYSINEPEPEPVPTEENVYTLYYEGKVDGVTGWPYNTYMVSFFPVMTSAVPVLDGMPFNGWNPSAIDWSKPDKIIDHTELRTAENGESYIYTIHEYVITVTGSFGGGNGGNDIPLGTPSTGSAEIIGFAAVLAIVGTGIALGTVIRRKKENDDAE